MRGSARGQRRRGPQATDVEELGGEDWLEPVIVEVGGRDVWLSAEGELEPPWQPPPRRSRLWPRLQGLAVLAVVGVVVFVLLPDRGLSDTERSRIESRLSAEAGRIAGHRAVVHCDARGETVGIVQHADGVAEIGGTNAYLTPAICSRLYRLAFKGDEGSFSQTARAIAVLAHEAWHLHGETDEGITNCYAFQSGVALGERLGLSKETARRMMRQQLADNATYARSAREYLVPAECRNGGRLDLAPTSGRFP